MMMDGDPTGRVVVVERELGESVAHFYKSGGGI
jgi:hypothetical protein